MRHLSKILPVIFLILFTEMLLGGTDGTIRGKVTDEESMGLPGATIYLPALGMGAAADPEGNFIILNIHEKNIQRYPGNDGPNCLAKSCLAGCIC